MLKKIFSKTDPTPSSDVKKTPVKSKNNVTKDKTILDKTDWQARLSAAIGDDTALLAIAREDAPLKVRQSAVEALQSEEGLKSAEREFRDHDRRIHRDAKSRLEFKIAERTARATAGELIAKATSLMAQDQFPVNHFIEIDHAWQALDSSKLEEAQIASFQSISEQITQLLRSRGDLISMVKRWTADSDRVLTELQTGLIAVAETGMDREKLAAVYDRADKINANAPVILDQDAQARDITHKKNLLADALHLARALDARLVYLDKIVADNQAGDTAAWNVLPPVADPTVANLLAARFETIRRTHQQSRDLTARKAKDAATEKNKTHRQEKNAALAEQLAAAEAALTAGHIVEATASLALIESSLKGTQAATPVNSRIEALRSEIIRLKGWQQWGGGRVREDLLAEAETLGKAITNEKLHLKSHADAIEKLRERWKELDKLGAATNRELWAKFDGALKTAYLPVSAQQAKLKAARQENLAARNLLIAALDNIVLAAAGVQLSTGMREIARALEHFQTEWRKLGPIEHTVPHKAQAALLARMKAGVARLETPLNDSRRIEINKREQLIGRARALATDSQQRDTINKVRELQSEWQQQAKALPLQRNTENRLWADFKAATDAIFQARDAVNSARDANLQTNANAKNELIGKLNALNADSPPAEIKRTIAEVDAAWRRSGEAPRNIAAKLEQRFRSARDAAQQFSAGSAIRGWAKTCDTLAAKLALCTAVEAHQTGQAGNAQESWQALSALADCWERPLSARFNSAVAGQVCAATAVDEILLKLESALDIESPPAFQAARREMKLRAMKNAIEARQAVTISNSDIEQWLAVVIAAPLLDAMAANRFQTILKKLPDRPLR